MKVSVALLLLVLLCSASALQRHRLMNHDSDEQPESDPEAEAAGQRMMTFMFSNPEFLAFAMSGDESAELPPCCTPTTKDR